MAPPSARPALAGLISIAFWVGGGAIGAGVSAAISAPWSVWVILVLAGYTIGYLAARQILRMLFIHWAQPTDP